MCNIYYYYYYYYYFMIPQLLVLLQYYYYYYKISDSKTTQKDSLYKAYLANRHFITVAIDTGLGRK
jgi:hypothetical protein